jgi:hypothetical protein
MLSIFSPQYLDVVFAYSDTIQPRIASLNWAFLRINKVIFKKNKTTPSWSGPEIIIH